MPTRQHTFQDFRDLVLGDESLQQELRAFDDQKEFVSGVVALAEAHGFHFTASDVEDELRRCRRNWRANA